MNILLVAGAGTSIELGVPAMVGLADEFIAHTTQWGIEPDLVRQILGASPDIEHLIEELDRICTAGVSLRQIAHEPAASLEGFDKVRAEVEWFIQHAAERVVARDAHAMWGSVLRASSRVELTIVTTNYDRAIELAANAEGISLDDGFGSFDEHEIARWVGFGQRGSDTRLAKLHGSTDWYAAAQSGVPTKLRHPMPLFGRALLRLPGGTELESALVLPSREKLLNRDPYPRLSQVFLNASDRCDFAVTVGSSLRDPHLRSAIQAIAQRVPLFIVNPDGDTYQIDAAIGIAQCASAFLIGTLPNALSSENPARTLSSAASAGTRDSILSSVKNALDSTATVSIRCQALENLDAKGTSLDAVSMKQLLRDPDAQVARYALGLIPLSEERVSLLAEAGQSVHVANGAYNGDLDLLRKLISI